MKLYADAPARRTRQLLGDLCLLVWVVLCVRLASTVYDATLALARPGAEIRRAGDGLSAQLRRAGTAVGDLPLVGDEIRAPFDGAGDAADQIARAGSAQVQAVHELAWWLALAVALIPVLLALAGYLPARWRFARTATAGQQFIDSSADLRLFALRAMARQPMHRLARVTDDPVGAWRRGDREVIRALALLELRDAGIEPPGLEPPA